MAANRSNIPKHELEILARHFLPQIQAFFETEQGRKEFEEWKAEQDELENGLKHTRAESANSLPLNYCHCDIKTINPNASPITVMKFGFIALVGGL